ncbi:MAG: aminotransferase class III [Bacteroidetes bacterium GWE2_42_24]|nr:MAG: aminotransferase class III [Bacteroidetes bacterium GWE2_42_24]OFY25417.1 MAG: aminotransferase class III [Bacteroidetes bacterium GWF2_43_11]
MMMSNRDVFYRYLGLPSTQPLGIEIERGEGIWLYAPDGSRYADLVSGVSVSNVGHCHPHVVEAVVNQAKRYMHLMVYGEMIQAPQTRLAQKLTSLLPVNLDCVYFVNSGSEAIEGAMKLAKRITHRPNICSFRNAYHGGTQGALSILGCESLKSAFRPLLPGIRQLNFNNFSDLQLIDESVACVIVEPIQAEAGVILPYPGFLGELRQRCTEMGVLLVFDEIQMGFGRTGKMFAFEKYGIIPDILCLAKAMGGGMPIGAFVASRERMLSFTFEPVLGHITTFGGHPVSCAAAIASLEVIENEELLMHVERKAAIFRERIISHPLVKEIRQIGLMMAVDVGTEEFLISIYNQLLTNHIITDRFLFQPSSFRIAPPLTISDEECHQMAALVLKSLDEIQI